MPDTFRDEVLGRCISRERYRRRVLWWTQKVKRSLASLNNEHQRREYYAILSTEFCRKNFAFFLFNFWRCFYPDGPRYGKRVEELYPFSRMAWTLANLVATHPDCVIDICKGRQIPMASHFFCAYFCWDAMFHPGRMILFHSKSLFHVGANAKGNPETLLGRVQFGYQRLPRYLQAVAPVDFDFNAQRPQAIFYHKGIVAEAPLTSTIMGVPDSYQADSATSFSPSAIFDDERGHQKNAKGFFETAIPAMMGRLFVRVGTPNSAEFPDALQDMRNQIASTEDADGNPETEWEELMPYSDSYQGKFLQQIMDNRTDHELGFRFLARRRKNGIVTCKIHFRAKPWYGKKFRQAEVNKIADPVRRAEEHDCEMFAFDVKHRLWRLSEHGSRHYDYDPNQTGEFRRIIRAWDFGKRSAVVFLQKVKTGPLPNSYQLRVIGEVCTNGPLVRDVAKMTHERMVQWFPDYNPAITPCIDYPDVAGRQSNRQTGQTDIQVVTDEMKKHEPIFYAHARRVGVDEGIDEVGLKTQEILGYEPKPEGEAGDPTPIPGMVVSPLTAPVTHRALSGALRQDEKGRIAKSKENQEWEHVADCYAEDTEVLTARGWKRFDAVRMDDEIATRDSAGCFVYQHPTALFWYGYAGQMVEITNKRCRLVVTPNHRMLSLVVGSRGKHRERIVKANNLTVHDSLITSATWTGVDWQTWTIPEFRSQNKLYPELKMDAGDFFEFMGWYLAEGWAGHRKPGKSQKEYEIGLAAIGPRDAALIEPLLARLPIEFHPYKSGYRFYGAQMWHYLEPLGCSHTKRIPREMLMASPRLLLRLWKGYVYGDGWTRGNTRECVATVSERLLDDMQELTAKTGRSLSKFVRPSRGSQIIDGHIRQCSDQFWGEIKRCRSIQIHDNRGRLHARAMDYDGMVGCVTVPNGIIYVRPPVGYPVWCGNCVRYVAAREIRRQDIVRDGMAVPTDSKPKAGLSPEERKKRVDAWMENSLENEIKRQRNLGNVPVTSDRYHQEV